MTSKADRESPFIVSDRGRTYVVRRKLTAQDILDQAHAIAASRFMRCRPIEGGDAAKDFLIAKLGNHDREVFAVVFLDHKHRVVAFEKLFFGTVSGVLASPREIARRALHHNASAIILAHNHPSGDPSPSDQDERVTLHIREALAILDIHVLDHIVVGGGAAVSMQQNREAAETRAEMERRASRRRWSKSRASKTQEANP